LKEKRKKTAAGRAGCGWNVLGETLGTKNVIMGRLGGGDEEETNKQDGRIPGIVRGGDGKSLAKIGPDRRGPLSRIDSEEKKSGRKAWQPVKKIFLGGRIWGT